MAISSEPTGVLEEEFVKKLGAKFWIGSDPDDDTMPGFVTGTEGVGIPHFYLIDATGKVVSCDEPPTEEQLKKLLEHVVDFRLARKLQPALRDAESGYQRLLLGPAYEAACRFATDKDKNVADDAVHLRQTIEKYTAHHDQRTKDGLKSLPPGERYGKLLELRYRYAGLPLATWAKDELATIAKDRAAWNHTDLKDFRAAWRTLDEALRREMKLTLTAYELGRVKKLYADVAKTPVRSYAHTIAVARLKALGGS